ncbi:hypothetical protein J6590_081944 [Homalodisca vitripennis]|nr:hypothetical protein J6590_081944 [Homalodisca vitripennis]
MRLDAVTSSPQFGHFLTDDLRRPSVALRNAVCLLAGENAIIIELATLLLYGRLTMERDEVWMDENRKRRRGVGRRWVSGMSKVRCLARHGGDWTVTRRVPIVCILIETTRGVSHGAVLVTVQQSHGAVMTRRGGGDGSAVARCGADEARADCLYTYSNNAWWRWRDSDDMRGDSRGAVLTTRTHTLSRSLKILSQIRSHTVCPRSGLGCSVPATAKVYYGFKG